MSNKIKRNINKEFFKKIANGTSPYVLAKCVKKGEIRIIHGIDAFITNEAMAINYILQISEAVMKSRRMIK